jgi:hypothetical protein
MTGGEVFDSQCLDTVIRVPHITAAENETRLMKFKEVRPLADPETAMAKLLEIANGLEADHTGRRSIGPINPEFLSAGGNVNEHGAAMHHAVAHGWLESHPSGAYVKLTQNGADRFA